jgi:DNA-binding transcriptional LysR family regulator
VHDHLLDLRLLRYALASSEHGSFRQAALALGVQQSSVSKGVGDLERRVGAPLFYRDHSGVRMTSAGEDFLKEAALGLDHFSRAVQAIGASQRGAQRRVTVAYSVPFHLFADVVESFVRENRAVSVDLIEDGREGSLALVQNQQADIAFVLEAVSAKGMRSDHLRDERIVAVMPRSHPMAGRNAILPVDLVSERLILTAGGFGPEVAQYLVRYLAPHGHQPTLQMQQVGQYDLLSMVARGLGITVAFDQPSPMVPGGLSLVPLADASPVPINAAWETSNSSPLLRQMRKVVRRWNSS